MQSTTLTEKKRKEAATAHDTMQAAVFAAPKEIKAQETPLPKPGPEEVLVKLEGCGVCASNIPTFEGREWFSYPQEAGAPGHEGWGVVVDKGDQVTKLEVGDRVAMLSYAAYAEYDIAHQDATLKLGKELEGKPFPGEPLGCAMNIFNRSDIHPGQTVAIIGVGFLGALLIQLCKERGAQVIALSRREYSLQVAKECGADHTIPLNDHWEIIEKVKEITGEKLCHRVIEATGKEWPLNLAGELLKNRGKLIIAGFHQDGMRSVNIQQWNWKGLDVINAHEREQEKYMEGMREAAKAVVEGRLNPDLLYTHSFPLEDTQKALEHSIERPSGFLKALILFS